MIRGGARRGRGGGAGGWIRALLAAPLLLVAAPSVSAQEDPRTEVLLAAVAEMRGAMPRARMAVDPTPFCTAGLVGWSCPATVQRALNDLRVETRGREFTYVCLGSGPRRCQLLGTESLVVLGEPSIRNREASVTVDLWWRRDRRDEPIGHRRVELELERTRDDWRVVRTVPRT